jgi:RHS repeat-associated protein
MQLIILENFDNLIFGHGMRSFRVFDDYRTMLPDALGSFRQVMQTRLDEPDASRLFSTTTYDPYGNVILQAGYNNDHGFTGEFQDSYIKLVALRSRMHSTNGTFLSRDTWDGDANLPMSYNRWMYTFGNPVKYTDPSGKQIYQYDRIAARDYAIIMGYVYKLITIWYTIGIWIN